MGAGASLFVAGAGVLLGAAAGEEVGKRSAEVVAPTVTNFTDYEVTFNMTDAEEWAGAGNLDATGNGTGSLNITATGLTELGDRRLLTAEEDAQSHSEVPVAEFDFSAGVSGVDKGSASFGLKLGIVAVVGGALLMLPVLI